MNKFSQRYDITKTFEFNKENAPFEEVIDKNPETKHYKGLLKVELR
jgi:hypothetical protein